MTITHNQHHQQQQQNNQQNNQQNKKTMSATLQGTNSSTSTNSTNSSSSTKLNQWHKSNTMGLAAKLQSTMPMNMSMSMSYHQHQHQHSSYHLHLHHPHQHVSPHAPPHVYVGPHIHTKTLTKTSINKMKSKTSPSNQWHSKTNPLTNKSNASTITSTSTSSSTNNINSNNNMKVKASSGTASKSSPRSRSNSNSPTNTSISSKKTKGHSNRNKSSNSNNSNNNNNSNNSNNNKSNSNNNSNNNKGHVQSNTNNSNTYHWKQNQHGHHNHKNKNKQNKRQSLKWVKDGKDHDSQQHQHQQQQYQYQMQHQHHQHQHQHQQHQNQHLQHQLQLHQKLQQNYQIRHQHQHQQKRQQNNQILQKLLDNNHELCTSLYSTLQSHGLFESNDGSQKRLNVLDSLEQLLCDWVDADVDLDSVDAVDSANVSNSAKDVSKDNNAESISRSNSTSKVRLISFGSYRLGVHNPTSDLDVLALCPPHVSRQYFFTSFVERLRKDKRVKGLHPIPGAYTPVIKFDMDDLSIDLLFATLTVANDEKLRDDGDGDNKPNSSNNSCSTESDKEIDSNADDTSIKLTDQVVEQVQNQEQQTQHDKQQPSLITERVEFELDDSMLIGVDEPTARSLNGVRVAQFLLDIIPNKTNFCIVLRTVKQWANVHGLYSNVLGFLGGINWAILVAFICEKNANASPPFLLKTFFQTFSRWRWPNPVQITTLSQHPPPGVTPLNVWDPKNRRDRAQLMPIITPAYPSMNSSYNVGQSQLRRLREELINGNKIMNKIAEGKVEWSTLLRGNTFFKDHSHYIEVSIISANAKDHRSWFGLCESRLRILIAGFESQEHGTLAYPFAKFFTRKVKDTNTDGEEESTESTKIVTSFFMGLRFSPGIDYVQLKSCTDEFLYMVMGWDKRNDSMDLTITHFLEKDLPEYIIQDDIVDLEKLELEEEMESKAKETSSDSPEKKLQVSVRVGNSPDDLLASPLKKAKTTKQKE